MEFKHPLIIFLIFSCFLCSTSVAFNITKILANISGYDNFNNLLTESGLAKKINSRQTITVLAVKDGLSDLTSKSKDVVEKVLSTHIILDYYDVEKLNSIKERSSILTTLFQASGEADHREGFLNVTRKGNVVLFGSAKKGAPLVASLVGSLVSMPYNLSVLQVSNVIQASGSAIVVTPSPPPPDSDSDSESPADAPTEADSRTADAPADDSSADAPSKAPAADSPADAPAADSPFASPPAPEDTASDDAPADAPAHSGSSFLRAGGVVTVVVAVAAGIVGI